MKWGRKKPPSSTSYYSRPSLISHVFPTSWLTKLKQMSINPGQEHAKVKQKGKWNSVSTNSRQFAGGEGGRFYGGDGDAFWRLSFGTDNADGEKSRVVLRSFQYDLDDPEFPPSSCHSCRPNAARLNNGKEDAFKFSDMVSEARKARGLPREEEILPEMDIREKVAEIRTPRLRVEREKKLRKANRRVFEDKQLELHGEPDEAERKTRKAAAQNIFEMESERTIGIIERKDCILTDSYSRKGCFISSTDSNDIAYASKVEDYSTFAAQQENDRFSSESLSSEWQKLKEMKIEEFKSKSEKQRKSLYIRRELQRKRHKQNSKGRAFSPRATPKLEICRIKALENTKAAKSKTKKKAKQKTMEGFTGLESFAVVKCSFDPQKDFRDSMIEMIEEKRISKPEELEELLACYLTLNADEYHDLIIKVFRQVWFDLNHACFDTELDKEQCYYE